MPAINEYYVDTVFGSDANDGSLKHPFCTTEQAHNVVPEGSWIYILDKNITPRERKTGRGLFKVVAAIGKGKHKVRLKT